jgi:hypothetical protein
MIWSLISVILCTVACTSLLIAFFFNLCESGQTWITYKNTWLFYHFISFALNLFLLIVHASIILHKG